jgi:hypothetical protein
LAALLPVACSKQGLGGVLHANQPPTVRLTQVPAPGDTTGTYAYEVSWAGFDPDGRVVRFFYAVDPPSRALAETAWVSTTENRHLFVFRSDSVASGAATRARGFHTIVVKCEDDQGASSPPVSASFTSTTVTPTVEIVSPVPSALLAAVVSPVIRISWHGNDVDGVGTTQPVSYRWKLFSNSTEFTPTSALADPDSVRRFYAPAFADWDSVGGDVNSVNLRDLVPGHDYMFIVVAFDQAGAYSPVFAASQNMLQFRIDATQSLGPKITIVMPGLSYTFPSGGFLSGPESYVRVDFAADHPTPLQWSAEHAPGGFIRGYRWAVDISRLDDETPRTNETTDLAHWSRLTTDPSTLLPAYSPSGSSETHLFYLEAEDDLGLRSLGIVQFTVVRPTFDHDLLIVNDTAFTPDKLAAGGCVGGPAGVWPSAAELDTFLFAVGGNNYRCYPAGTRSPVGVFAGYSYDTLCTHFTTPRDLNLVRLDRYRNIVWMTDLTSAFFYTNPYNTNFRPMPLLREWSSSTSQNPLATWLLQGGRLWLLGGGGAMASLIDYDQPRSENNVFSAALGELGPGRMMYDDAHWQSEIRVLSSFRAVRSTRAVGGWPGAPDYSALPDPLVEKSPATDPLPPLRTSNFYLTAYPAEVLSKSNEIVEGAAGDPARNHPISTLDTLYETQGGAIGSGWPIMTLYHGGENSMFVFSGFPIWYFQRSQTIDLVDFVLQRVWGLSRKPVAR